jgi:hypothetical protein
MDLVWFRLSPKPCTLNQSLLLLFNLKKREGIDFGHFKFYILLPKLTCTYVDLHDYKTICSPDGQQLLVGTGQILILVCSTRVQALLVTRKDKNVRKTPENMENYISNCKNGAKGSMTWVPCFNQEWIRIIDELPKRKQQHHSKKKDRKLRQKAKTTI